MVAVWTPDGVMSARGGFSFISTPITGGRAEGNP